MDSLPYRSPERVALHKLKSSRGGIVSAAKLSPAQRSARSEQNGNTTLQRYGIDYYAAMGRLSKKLQDARKKEKPA